MSEFNWWLLIVGLVIGAGLVWLILSDSMRRESRAADEELAEEAYWIATTLAEAGQPLDEADVEQVLRLHRTWLATLPPEDADDWLTEETAEATTEPRTVTAAPGELMAPRGATPPGGAAPPGGATPPRGATRPGDTPALRHPAAPRKPTGRDSAAEDADYARDDGPGTTPIWSATEPSPRRR